MTQRSREEIENQLRPKHLQPRSKKKKNLTEPPKSSNTRVIGGSIDEVNSTSTLWPKSLFSKKTISFGLAALLLFIALFVLFGSRNKQETLSDNIDNASTNYQTEANEDTSFTREDDVSRAQSFRQNEIDEKNIQLLINKGLLAFQKGDYTQPQNESALKYFRQALTIDSDNFRAKEGIEAIESRFLAIGEEHLVNDEVVSANKVLTILKSINIDSYYSSKLSKDITSYEQLKPLRDMLTNGRLAEQENRWISPEDDSAYYYYTEVLALDEKNEDAIAGISRVVKESINKANSLVLENQLENADRFISVIQTLAPDHPSLGIFRAQLTQLVSEQLAQTNNQTTNNIENELNSLAIAPTRSFAGFNDRDRNLSVAELDESNLLAGLTAEKNGDYASAISLLTPIADKGISRARARLALIYHLGLGGNSDRGLAELYAQQAIEPLRRFAAEGRDWAQADLGSMYAYGLAVNRNFDLALNWRLQAADQLNPEALRQLGDMYFSGTGVSRSIDNAKYYYRLASDNGDIEAINKLRLIP